MIYVFDSLYGPIMMDLNKMFGIKFKKHKSDIMDLINDLTC